MALHDWNHNGKDDMMDNYIEYKIYEESKKNNNTSGDGGGCSTVILFFLVIILLLKLFS